MYLTMKRKTGSFPIAIRRNISLTDSVTREKNIYIYKNKNATICMIDAMRYDDRSFLHRCESGISLISLNRFRWRWIRNKSEKVKPRFSAISIIPIACILFILPIYRCLLFNHLVKINN